MAIRNKKTFYDEKPANFDGIFEWDYLIPVLRKATGRDVQPMDIDCHVEINGQHMVIETKQPEKDVPKGQRAALLQLWAKGDHMVIFMWGKEQPVRLEVFYPHGERRLYSWKQLLKKKGDIEEEAGIMFVLDVVYRWAKWADEERRSPFRYNGALVNDEGS